MPLHLDSERVGPTGNVTSQGVLNQLGRPQMEALAVLVREAVQNSWDARASSDAGITFGVAGWTLSKDQQSLFRDQIFARLPPQEHLPLSKHLHSNKPMNVLAIYDRGTTGLGGPTRADRPSKPGEARDFVDFLRNVGQPPDKQFAGGTYGYGKAAFYRVSHTQTICVFTRCIYEGKRESRFIAAALGSPYSDADGMLHTGRHWWGQHVDGIAEPLVSQAEGAAERIGIRKFLGQDDLGTVILILQPALELQDEEQDNFLRTPFQGMNFIAENILLYFWPKMLKYGKSSPPIKFEISWENQPIPLPDPEEFPPLQGFVHAMYHVKGLPVTNGFPNSVVEVRSERPIKLLGKLALQKHPLVTIPPFDTGRKESVFARLNHHTALMRQPELVVKYVSGSPSANPQLGIYGVFISDREVDGVFADSEPPTHDDWVSSSLSDRWHRVYVNVTYKRISEQMESFAKPAEARSNSRQLTPLGAFSNSLGSSLLPSVPGNAASTPFSKQYQPPRQSNLTSKPTAAVQTNTGSQTPSPSPGRQSVYDQFRALLRGNTGSSTGNAVPASPSVPPLQPLPPAPSFSSSFLGQQSGSNESNDGAGSSRTNNGVQNELRTQPQVPRRTPKLLGVSKVSSASRGEFVVVDGRPAFKVAFSVEHGKNAVGTEVSVAVRAVIDGDTVEDEPPIGGSRSEVIRWIDSDETIYAGNPSVFVALSSGKDWAVVVSLPDDMMIELSFQAGAKGEDE